MSLLLPLRRFALPVAAFWLMVCCLITSTAYAQEPTYIQYGSDQGLPSSEVYHAISDDRGYMWFGTDRGLVRFDGYEFKVFTKKDGLPSDAVYQFRKDHTGAIWASTLDGFFCLNDDEVTLAPFNSVFRDSVGRELPVDFFIDREDGALFATTYGRKKYVRIDTNGNLTSLLPQPPLASNFLQVTSKDRVLGGLMRHNQGGARVQINFPGQAPLALGRVDSGNFELRGVDLGPSAVKWGDTVVCATFNYLYRLEGRELVDSVRLPTFHTRSMFRDNSGNLWCGLFSQGVVRFPNGDFSNPRYFLPGRTVTGMAEDREGGMWFTTRGSGVYYLPHTEVFSLRILDQELEQPLIALAAEGDRIWTASKHGTIFSFNLVVPGFYERVYGQVDNVFYLERFQDQLWVGTNLGDVPDTVLSGVCLVNGRDGWLDTERGLFWQAPTTGNPNSYPPLGYPKISSPGFGKNHWAICVWQNQVFSGGPEGLFVSTPDTGAICSKVDLGMDIWVTDLMPGTDHLFIGTKDYGLLVYDGQEFWSIDAAHGMPVNGVETIEVESDERVWVGTKAGVCKLDIDHAERDTRLTLLSSADGLASNEIHDLLLHQGQLWVATSNGLTWFDKDRSFRNPVPPKVIMEQIVVNRSPVDLSVPPDFSPKDRVFDFKFVGLSYRSLGTQRYRYRLVGFDKGWSITTNREVRYMLSPGSYTFEVSAQNDDGVWGNDITTYSFVIPAPVWQRWWFLTLLGLAIAGGVYGLFTARIKQLRHRSALELGMAQSQQQALAAQLKPHFVFNALNSIHNYMLKNDIERSSNYLMLLAKLIRRILNNSRKTLITLDEEIQLVENYLEVEQLRFKEKMTFSISVDEQIDLHAIMIPSQLIQPFVENAIWHGLMHKDDPGHISLTVRQRDDIIECVITDDGIGRKAAAEYASDYDEHESSGIRMSRERLDLIRAIYKRPVDIRISDLEDQHGQPAGTQVTLTIPTIH